ncbi:DUF4038 domain-containing protein [Streptomyces sp. NPDC050549]|uniref:apiosidase-like domain-containing protein n=1 Tax=Streptomyces sp. NPDC050549 TaxID=3155406 RepID=UPI00343A38BD
MSGTGRVTYVVGSVPDRELSHSPADWIAATSLPPDASSVTCTSAAIAEGAIPRFVHNWAWEPVDYRLPEDVRDLPTGESLAAGSALALGPWDVRVLVESARHPHQPPFTEEDTVSRQPTPHRRPAHGRRGRARQAPRRAHPGAEGAAADRRGLLVPAPRTRPRYLVARYGAAPTVHLVGADGEGGEAQIAAGGTEIGRWDGYGQPCGIHYRPHSANRAHQSESWLHFQWCQTGHMGGHVQERVADTWRNTPPKAVANGEPTYENTGRPGRAAGRWQGHEAWSNLCAGGTMGVVYSGESVAVATARRGTRPRGLLPREGRGMARGARLRGLAPRRPRLPHPRRPPAHGHVPGLALHPGTPGPVRPGELYLCCAEEGGPLIVTDPQNVPLPYRLMDPRTGATVREGVRATAGDPVPHGGGAPRVHICHDPRGS